MDRDDQVINSLPEMINSLEQMIIWRCNLKGSSMASRTSIPFFNPYRVVPLG
jgi:hypothetical protein